MQLFKKNTSTDSFITLYKGEGNLHPSLEEVFEWGKTEVWDKIKPDAHEKVFLAGGALRSFFCDEVPRDFDLYFKNKEFLGMCDTWLQSHGYAAQTDSKQSIVRRQTAVTRHGGIKHTVMNLISNNFFDSPEEVIKSFDFTICMCALTPEYIVFHPDYFTDLALKTLRVFNPKDAIRTLWRIQKYVQKGYTIAPEEMWKLVQSIHDLPNLPKILGKDNAGDTGAIPVAELFRGS